MITRVAVSTKGIKSSFAKSSEISNIFEACAEGANVEVKHAQGLVPCEIKEDGFELFSEHVIIKGKTDYNIVDGEVQKTVIPDFALTGNAMDAKKSNIGTFTPLLIADFEDYEAATSFLRGFRQAVLNEDNGDSVHGGLHIEKGDVPTFDPLKPQM